MFTLTTHQASTWGYSLMQHLTLPITVSGSTNYVGAFTKPILAPNGNMYAISTCATVTINSVVYNSVVLKITPGNTNTNTTDWTPATFSYIPADGTTPDANGFGKQNWEIPTQISYNTGVLASNGLIYFPPNEATKWVVFNPTTEKWKITNQYKPSTTTTLGQYHINSAVLGIDNKIYVLGSASYKGFRITTSPLATSDTIEDSYYNTFSGGSPLGATAMTWKDSNNNNYTDSATASGTVFKAYGHKLLGSSYNRNLTIALDVLVHPSGKIFINPGSGRGRIFYIDPSQWGTDREIVSEPAYFVDNYSPNNMFEGSYLILEKPRDADHQVNTLKIYVLPSCIPTSGIYGNSLASTYLYVIDPFNKTMEEVSMDYIKTGNANQYRAVGPKINLPNGHSIVYNTVLNSEEQSQGGVIITGKDVPDTITTGGNFIKTTDKSIFHEKDDGTIYSVLDKTAGRLMAKSPSYTGVNGSCTPKWPHNGKTIVGAEALLYTEIVSVKGYGPNITNFNFSEEDKLNYTLTDSNLSSLGATLYNSQFNTPK